MFIYIVYIYILCIYIYILCIYLYIYIYILCIYIYILDIYILCIYIYIQIDSVWLVYFQHFRFVLPVKPQQPWFFSFGLAPPRRPSCRKLHLFSLGILGKNGNSVAMAMATWTFSRKKSRIYGKIILTHRIHGAAIYGNMDPISIPPMLAYIYIPYMDPMGT